MVQSANLCPTFHPTKAEYNRPFCDYVSKVLAANPDLPMFKVVPPEGWQARSKPFPRLDRINIACPIKQLVFGTRGAYRCVLVEQKPVTVSEFKKLANDDAHRLVHKQRDEDDSLMERAFWSSVTINPPLYGADTPQSFFDEQTEYGWNLRHLGGDLLKERGVPSVPGVTTPMTYFGMWKSFFAWHVEDADLLSVNFLHFGAPKIWYSVPPSQRAKFDAMAATMFPELRKGCPAFMRHKDILFSPSMLRTYNIEFMQAKQEPGEFIVLNAGAYHAGFNHGFNCAEAINFATHDWIPVGKAAVACTCSALRDGVQIDMGLFGCGSSSEEEESGEEEEEEGGSSGDEGESLPSCSGADSLSSSLPGGRDSDGEEEPSAVTSRATGRGRGKAAAAAKGAGRAGKGRGGKEGAKKPRGRPRKEAGGAVAEGGKRGRGKAAEAAAAAEGGAKKRARPALGVRKTAATKVVAAAPKAVVVRRARGLRKLTVMVAPGGGTGATAPVRKRPRPAAAPRKRSSSSSTAAAGEAAVAAAPQAKRARKEPAVRGPAAVAPAAAAAAELPVGAGGEHGCEAGCSHSHAHAHPHSTEACGTHAGHAAAGGSLLPQAEQVGQAGEVVVAPATPDQQAKVPVVGGVSRPSAAAGPSGRGEAAGGARRRVGVRASEVADDKPAAVVGEDDSGKRVFWMVHRLKRRPSRKGYLVFQWLREDADGLFRGSGKVWEERPESLVPVRTQWVAGGKQGKAGGFKLLTLRSRILSTELLD